MVEYCVDGPTVTETGAEHDEVPARQTRYVYELFAFFGSVSTYAPLLATVATRRLLRKTSACVEVTPLQASDTVVPETVAFRVIAAGGGGGGGGALVEVERRIAPVVGSSVTEVVVVPSSRS